MSYIPAAHYYEIYMGFAQHPGLVFDAVHGIALTHTRQLSTAEAEMSMRYSFRRTWA